GGYVRATRDTPRGLRAGGPGDAHSCRKMSRRRGKTVVARTVVRKPWWPGRDPHSCAGDWDASAARTRDPTRHLVGFRKAFGTGAVGGWVAFGSDGHAAAIAPSVQFAFGFGHPTPDAVGLTDLERVGAALHQHRAGDRKSTRLNSSHVKISYAVF